MPKKTKKIPRPPSLARKIISEEYMGIPATISREEMDNIDKIIDVSIDDAIVALANSPWRKNDKSQDSISVGESPDEKEEGDEK